MGHKIPNLRTAQYECVENPIHTTLLITNVPYQYFPYSNTVVCLSFARKFCKKWTKNERKRSLLTGC